MPKMPTTVALCHSDQKKLDQDKHYLQAKKSIRDLFIHYRFEFFADDHNGSIISGSTFSHPKEEKSEIVLDASEIDFIYDQAGVRIGFAMATGDGLSHSTRHEENVSIGMVTRHACSKLVALARRLNGKIPVDAIPKLFSESGQVSKLSNLFYAVKDAHGKVYEKNCDSKSSNSFVSVAFENGKFTGSVGNVGDGMVLIIDSQTQKVKHIVPAVHYGRPNYGGAVEWSPQAIQDLEDKTLDHVDHNNLSDLNEDDIVIQMTDGAWSEFPTISKELKDKNGGLRREISIDPTAIEHLLVEIHTKISSSDTLPAHVIGYELLNAIADKALMKRALYLSLLERIKPHFGIAQDKIFNTTQQYESYTVSKWIDEIRATDTKLADDFLVYLANQQEGVIYKLECPAQMFIQRIEGKPFGDCCTIAVMRVPNQKLELVRALIENPKNRSLLLPQIHTLSDADLVSVFQRLRNEVYIDRPDPKNLSKDDVKGRRLCELAVTVKSTYPVEKDQIEEAKKTIRAYKIHREWVKAVKDGNEEFIKAACNNGEDQNKFVEFMLLGLNPNDKDPDQKGLSALLVAATNKTGILNFIVERAMQNTATQELLAKLLLEKNAVGQNVLHQAACIPDNELAITILCETARVLYAEGITVEHPQALANFVNLTEANHGSALHFSVLKGNFSNYQALIAAKADTKAKENLGRVATEMLPYGDLTRAAIFMKSWIQHTDEGKNYLIKRYGCNYEELPEQFLNALLKIELNIMIHNQPQAQLSALAMALRLIASVDGRTGKTLDVSLATIGYINFKIITAESLAGDPSQAIVKQIMDSAAAIKKPELKNICMQAELLRQYKEHRQANRTAFDLYGTEELIKEYPTFALEGLVNLNRNLLDKFVLTKRIVAAMAYFTLNNLKNTLGIGLFTNKAPKILTRFLENMQKVASCEEVVVMIKDLPRNNSVDTFRESTLKILRQAELFMDHDSSAVQALAGSK